MNPMPGAPQNGAFGAVPGAGMQAGGGMPPAQNQDQNRTFMELDVRGNTGAPVSAETVNTVMRTAIAKTDVDGEDEESTQIGAIKTEKAVEYLTYGYCEEGSPEWLALEDTLEYLRGREFCVQQVDFTEKYFGVTELSFD